MKRFELNFDEDKINDIFNKDGASYDLKECCKLLNKLNDECKFLADQRDYWKQKYEEGTETFTLPPNCDKCNFLGNNGICGYCKFTLKCYDSKEDFIDGEVLPNCPLKPLINENEQLRNELQLTKEYLQLIKEYLQIKIDECKNHKKMKEIVFGVEQAVGYEKALLKFQKGLKRRLNDE